MLYSECVTPSSLVSKHTRIAWQLVQCCTPSVGASDMAMHSWIHAIPTVPKLVTLGHQWSCMEPHSQSNQRSSVSCCIYYSMTHLLIRFPRYPFNKYRVRTRFLTGLVIPRNITEHLVEYIEQHLIWLRKKCLFSRSYFWVLNWHTALQIFLWHGQIGSWYMYVSQI